MTWATSFRMPWRSSSSGAQGDMIEKLARQLVSENQVRIDRAEVLLEAWQKKTNER